MCINDDIIYIGDDNDIRIYNISNLSSPTSIGTIETSNAIKDLAIENTVPNEFRAAIREGVLAWNIAFENIGFKNAVVVKQMPDDATWDPGDVRYNTIRWFVQPGSAYAVGPSRANPITGEIYDTKYGRVSITIFQMGCTTTKKEQVETIKV